MTYRQQIERLVANLKDGLMINKEDYSVDIITQLLALMDEFGEEAYKKGYIDAGIAALKTNNKGVE